MNWKLYIYPALLVTLVGWIVLSPFIELMPYAIKTGEFYCTNDNGALWCGFEFTFPMEVIP